MEGQREQQNSESSSSSINCREKNKGDGTGGEPVRSRWTPKPEQILILESIFNSGMVNPPKEETIRIRKLLEKFGQVGDANVFYWFQNRRSRSRRRHRQLQASLAAAAAAASSSPPPPPPPPLELYGTHQLTCSGPPPFSDDPFAALASQQMAVFPQQLQTSPSFSPILSSTHVSSFNLEIPISAGTVTVLVNGVATQVPEGPIDMKVMFGEEVILVHSSGLPVPVNQYGFSLQSLQQGESYFLVPRFA